MNMRVAHRVDDTGIGWIEFSCEDPSPVMGSGSLAGLRAAIDALAGSAVAAVVVTSTTDVGLSKGADLNWLASLKDPAAACEYSRKGQRLFEALEGLAVPTLCAIHGPCIGPGLELALACRARIASDDPTTQFGFGEQSALVIPCWGGCVRLPQLVGAEEALDRMISGEPVGARDALNTGYIDELVPASRLQEEARFAARRAGNSGPAVRLTPPRPDSALFGRMRALARMRPADHQVAALAAVEVVERGIRLQRRAASEIETTAFGQLALNASTRSALAAAASRSGPTRGH